MHGSRPIRRRAADNCGTGVPRFSVTSSSSELSDSERPPACGLNSGFDPGSGSASNSAPDSSGPSDSGSCSEATEVTEVTDVTGVASEPTKPAVERLSPTLEHYYQLRAVAVKIINAAGDDEKTQLLHGLDTDDHLVVLGNLQEHEALMRETQYRPTRKERMKQWIGGFVAVQKQKPCPMAREW